MRHDKRHVRQSQRHRVQIDGIRKTHVEWRRESELLRTPTVNTPQCTNTVARGRGGDCGSSSGCTRSSRDRVAVHRREETDYADERHESAPAPDAPWHRARVGFIMKNPKKRSWIGLNRSRDRCFIAGHARNQGGARNAVFIKFVYPLRGELQRDLAAAYPNPANSSDRPDKSRSPRLEWRRKNCARRNGRAHRRRPDHPRVSASITLQLREPGRGELKRVTPAASASCVSPATLFTFSFFIIVLR